jgi:tripartite-type tricarboxylate transporter receptor subunit TctC
MGRRGARWLMAVVAVIFVYGVAGPIPAAVAYPDRPITIIVPWPAGGGADLVGRLASAHLESKLKVPVVVRNVPGAAGETGARVMAAAQPDGYTFGVVGAATTVRQYLLPDATQLSKFDAIAAFPGFPMTITVGARTPWQTLAQLLDHARANPGAIKLSTDPPGGGSWVAAVLAEDQLGVKFAKIPYPGYAPERAAVLAGEVEGTTIPAGMLVDNHRAGDVRVLGVLGAERYRLLPDVPTIQEVTGRPVIFGSWETVVAPRGTPTEHLRVIEKTLLGMRDEAELMRRMLAVGLPGIILDREASRRLWAEDEARLVPVLKALGLITR